MPQITGLEFIKSLSHRPQVILATAYDEYAVEGFNMEVIGSLLKPIPFDRFLRSALKAKEWLELKDIKLNKGFEESVFAKY